MQIAQWKLELNHELRRTWNDVSVQKYIIDHVTSNYVTTLEQEKERKEIEDKHDWRPHLYLHQVSSFCLHGKLQTIDLLEFSASAL